MLQTTVIYLVFSATFLLLHAENDSNSTQTHLSIENSSEEFNSSDLKPRMIAYHCDTPNDDVGFCIPINNCTKLLTQKQQGKSEEFIEASRCGPKNEMQSNFYVCCGKYSNYQVEQSAKLEEVRKSKSGRNPLPKTCGHQNITMRSRIFGGRQALLGEFPWLARLYHKDSAGIRTFGCTGFLIAPKFVLTAAHCLASENTLILGPVSEVHLGEHDTDRDVDCNSKNVCADKVQKMKVNKTIPHPSYNATSKHHHDDIGLIYLKKGAKLSPYVSPICILEKWDFQPAEFWLSGWGTTETESASSVKMKVSVPLYPHSNCTKKYEKFAKIIDKQLCAGGGKNQDSCTGDSGGPLMVVAGGTQWYAAGVVSYGLGCGKQGWPAIYTNVTQYTEWIKSTMLWYQKHN